MSANNVYSLLNETEGSDTSYRTIHLTRAVHLLPGMPWTETLKEDFGVEPDTVSLFVFCYSQVEEHREEKVQEPVVIDEEKTQVKKVKKQKKTQKRVVEEEDIDSILKEMGVESRLFLFELIASG